MRTRSALFLGALATSLLVSFTAQSNEAPAAGDKVADGAELDAVFVPAEADEVAFQPRAYAGELVFTEVVAHGTYVNEGDVVARFDAEQLEEELRDAELAVGTKRLEHDAKLEQAQIGRERAALTLAERKAAVERARRALEGWEKYELDFKSRTRELQAQVVQHGIDDQLDELAQLESMYRDDELVDATEEIVLKRARRRLASSRVSQKLSTERRTYEASYEVALETEAKRERVVRQESELVHLVREQALEELTRVDGLQRSQLELEKATKRMKDLAHDRDAMVVRSPRAGVVLHGGERSALPGNARPDHRVGGKAGAHGALLCVADPNRLALALAVGESKLASVRTGMVVKAYATVTPGKELLGTLTLASYPTPESGTADEARFDARVALEGTQAGIVAGMRARVAIPSDEDR